MELKFLLSNPLLLHPVNITPCISGNFLKIPYPIYFPDLPLCTELHFFTIALWGEMIGPAEKFTISRATFHDSNFNI